MLPTMNQTKSPSTTPSPKPLAAILATVALAAAAPLAAGCGGSSPDAPGSVPSGDIAAIGTDGGAVSKAQFDRFLAAQISGRSPLGGSIAGSIPLDPPGFSKCSAALAANEANNRQPKSSAAQLKSACKAQYQQSRDAVESQLISYQWLLAEAKDAGIEVDGKDVQRTLDQYIAATATVDKTRPSKAKAKFDAKLKRSGLTLADIKLQLEAQLAQQKLTEEDAKSVDEPSNDEAEKFYAKNKNLFVTAGAKKPPPFKQVAAQVKATLRSQKIQVKQVGFQNSLQKKWRAATLCAKGYIVAQCSNGPKLPDLVPPKVD